ncbi:MAG TPA: ATP phosphoribosyltransferase regulatory subunit, partial [Alphaproteobacteria bacterium]|nr:ATP phosphoribosyltransferase regulatory subunit [Alphaproteobacteria bacterium]
MTELERKALLPAGLRDVLPPFAAFEAEVIERLMARFAASGYARIKTPLVEFEDGLLSGPGAAMTADTFRLMDPISQRMMGVRADITPQIARIASTRLGAAPRPLRLGYSGEVLRVKGTQLRPERQFAQVGAELIGAECAAADAEMIVLAVDALGAVGVADLTVDLTIPPLVPALLDGAAIDGGRRAELREALDHKDTTTVAEIGGDAAPILSSLVAAAGPAEHCFAVLEDFDLPDAAALERDRIGEVLEHLREALPELRITLDPVENRGFEYHSGVSFTIFPAAGRGELGAGGRYQAAGVGGNEPATGFTLYLDTILRVLPGPELSARIYLPVGADPVEVKRLRKEGWITIGGLEAIEDDAGEARRLGCSHVWL